MGRIDLCAEKTNRSTRYTLLRCGRKSTNRELSAKDPGVFGRFDSRSGRRIMAFAFKILPEKLTI